MALIELSREERNMILIALDYYAKELSDVIYRTLEKEDELRVKVERMRCMKLYRRIQDSG